MDEANEVDFNAAPDETTPLETVLIIRLARIPQRCPVIVILIDQHLDVDQNPEMLINQHIISRCYVN